MSGDHATADCEHGCCCLGWGSVPEWQGAEPGSPEPGWPCGLAVAGAEVMEPAAVEAESLLWSHLEPAVHDMKSSLWSHAMESCYGVTLRHHCMLIRYASCLDPHSS